MVNKRRVLRRSTLYQLQQIVAVPLSGKGTAELKKIKAMAAEELHNRKNTETVMIQTKLYA